MTGLHTHGDGAALGHQTGGNWSLSHRKQTQQLYLLVPKASSQSPPGGRDSSVPRARQLCPEGAVQLFLGLVCLPSTRHNAGSAARSLHNQPTKFTSRELCAFPLTLYAARETGETVSTVTWAPLSRCSGAWRRAAGTGSCCPHGAHPLAHTRFGQEDSLSHADSDATHVLDQLRGTGRQHPAEASGKHRAMLPLNDAGPSPVLRLRL